MGGSAIADLEPGELAAAGALLASAFRDNPINRAVIAGSPARRLRCNRAGHRASLPIALQHGWCRAERVDGALRAVLVAEPATARRLPLPPLAAQLRCLVEQGWRVARRWQEVHGALAGLRPAVPHWYLDLLGVAPEHQGRGLGQALLGDLLARVDAEGAASYLETDRPGNLPFYERAGYAVLSRNTILGTPVWRLWREGLGVRGSGGSDVR